MIKVTNFCALNGLTGPEALINSINLFASRLANQGIHGSIYFMDSKLEHKHKLCESSWDWEVVIDGKDDKKIKNVARAAKLSKYVFGEWNDHPDLYSQCFPHFRYEAEYSTIFCPRLKF